MLGQMLLPPCEEEKKEEEEKQGGMHLGERGVYSQRVDVHVMKTVELYMLIENIVLLCELQKTCTLGHQTYRKILHEYFPLCCYKTYFEEPNYLNCLKHTTVLINTENS